MCIYNNGRDVLIVISGDFRTALAWALIVVDVSVSTGDACVASGIRIAQRIVPHVGIQVPALWIRRVLVHAWIIGAHEPSKSRVVVASDEVIEAGFAVAFLAGEFVVGAVAARDLFAEGQVVQRVIDGLVQGGEEAGRAEVVGGEELSGGKSAR